ncbi:MAG: bifunctional riboflavin kinase/FAD synthetase [Clostridiales bacterium]|nr:bifunctional riboflavin kinase/FAD synthetase [Candidatus Crickella equi]
MQIFTSVDDIRIEEKTAVALGNFDGIHIGHTEILKNAIEAAKLEGLKSLCYTFSNHPFNFIMHREATDPEAIKLICSEEDKIAMLEEMGFDYLVNVPFDEVTMKMHAHDFFEDILVKKLNAAVISVGFNYTYGTRAEGKAEDLLVEGATKGIEVHVHDAVMYEDKVVSSTLIREMIAAGDMAKTEELLGRPYAFTGVVEHGKSVGKQKGFPTVNIVPEADRALPPKGVYAAITNVEGVDYKSIANLGIQPTFDGTTTKIESHLFDYCGNAYDKNIIVSLKKFIRPEMKFASSDELYEQIRKDCEAVL